MEKEEAADSLIPTRRCRLDGELSQSLADQDAVPSYYTTTFAFAHSSVTNTPCARTHPLRVCSHMFSISHLRPARLHGPCTPSLSIFSSLFCTTPPCCLLDVLYLMYWLTHLKPSPYPGAAPTSKEPRTRQALARTLLSPQTAAPRAAHCSQYAWHAQAQACGDFADGVAQLRP